MTSFRQTEAIEAMRSAAPVRKPKPASGGRGEPFGTDWLPKPSLSLWKISKTIKHSKRLSSRITTLVLRLASLLWRMHRATAVETDLLQVQAEILNDRRHEYETGDDSGQKPQSVVYRVLQRAIGPSRRRHVGDGSSHADQSESIDDQWDPLGLNAMIQAADRGTWLIAFCVSPTSTMECLNGSDAMRLRYGDRSCRRCLRFKRSGTDNRLVAASWIPGNKPARLVGGASTLGCSGQSRIGRAIVPPVSLILLTKIGFVP
jgi:hypothetical protein